jgi:hypothetical protein
LFTQALCLVEIDQADQSAQGNYTCKFIEEYIENVCARKELKTEYLRFESKAIDMSKNNTKHNPEDNKVNSAVNVQVSREIIYSVLSLFPIIKIYGQIF